MRKQHLLRVIAFTLVLSLVLSLVSIALAGYDTIPYGEQSDNVRKLQKALKTKNHYRGAIDGKFGPATKKAVEKFQKSIGIHVDGKPGNKTLTALYEGTTAINTSSNIDRKVNAPKNPRTLYYGNKGSRVSALQRGLKELSCYSGPIDGKYGDLTYEAVKKFQYKYGLTPDGMAGPKTVSTLNKNVKNKVSASFVLEVGSSGTEVDKVQDFLKSKGYSITDEKNYFGESTKTAVTAWQTATGATATGKITESQYNDIVLPKKTTP